MLSLATLKTTAAAGLFALLTQVVSGQDFSVGQPIENCLWENYMNAVGDGSSTQGYAFCASKHKQGILIKSLEWQGDEAAIRGLIVTYTDGTTDQFGKMQFKGREDTRHQKFDFDPLVDVFTQLQVWPDGLNGGDKRSVGRLALKISNGVVMDLMRKNPSQGLPNVLNIGNSGMLLGIAGRANDAIDRIEFIFAKGKIRTRSIENMALKPTVEEINLRKSNEERGFSVEDLDFVVYRNDNDHDDDYLMRGEKKRSKTTTFTKTSTDTFHLGLGFEVKIAFGAPPLVNEITRKMDVFWEKIETLTNTQTTTEEVTLSYQRSGTIPAHGVVYCNAYSFKGTAVDVSWTGMSRITFMDDTYMEFPSAGLYNTAQFTRTNTICGPWNGTDADAAQMITKVQQRSANGLRQPLRSIGARSKAKLPPYPLQ